MVALYKFFLSLAIITTQFYVFSSGVPQPSYLLYVVFIVLFWLANNGVMSFRKNVPIEYCLCFFAYVTLINGVFSILLQNWEMNYFSVYLLYNILVFIFVYEFVDRSDKNKTLLFYVFSLALLLLCVITALGYGRYGYYPRYNAYFNDPNQMAFWVICTFASVCLISRRHFNIKFVLCLMSAFMISRTMSRSGFVAMAFIFLGVALNYYESFGSSKSLFSLRNSIVMLSCVVLIPIVAIALLQSDIFSDVVSRLGSTDFAEQAEVRGYTRIVNYPEYLLFGSGQGLDSRFGSPQEIHSTWVAFLFYYGIIGLTLFVLFLLVIYKGMSLASFMIAVSPLMYSFSTFGARTPVFWVFLAVACCCQKKR